MAEAIKNKYERGEKPRPSRGHHTSMECVEALLRRSETVRQAGLTQDFYDNTLKPFARKLATDLFHAFNSAGWFVAKHRDRVLIAMDAGLENSNVRTVTIAINGGTSHLDERQRFTRWLRDFFKFDTECINR